MKKRILLFITALSCLTGFGQTYTLNFDEPFGTTAWTEDGFSWSYDGSGWDNIRSYYPNTGTGHAMSAAGYSSKLSASGYLLNVSSIWLYVDNAANFSHLKVNGYDGNGNLVGSINLNPSSYQFSYGNASINLNGIKSIEIDFDLLDWMGMGDVFYDDMEYSVSCDLDAQLTQGSTGAITGSNVQFSASAGSGSTYQWQTRINNLGWMNVPDNSTYSGGQTGNLTVNNIQLSNHQQEFRCYAVNGSCVDTSAIAVLSISDTCVNTVNDTNVVTINDTNVVTINDTNHVVINDTNVVIVNDTNVVTVNDTNVVIINDTNLVTVTDTNYVTVFDTVSISVTDTTFITLTDTSYISVTDTLVINALISGLVSPNNVNSIKIYPNPAHTHVYIDYGDYKSLTGYSIKVNNYLDQTVYTSPVDHQMQTINLSNLGGNGLYLIYLINDQGNAVDVRKILVQ